MSQAHELDQKIQDVYKRIQTERKVLEASRILSQATTNPDVLRRNDAAIREAERSISYFEETLRELQSRKMMQAQRTDHSRSGSMVSQVRTTIPIPRQLFLNAYNIFLVCRLVQLRRYRSRRSRSCFAGDAPR